MKALKQTMTLKQKTLKLIEIFILNYGVVVLMLLAVFYMNFIHNATVLLAMDSGSDPANFNGYNSDSDSDQEKQNNRPFNHRAVEDNLYYRIDNVDHARFNPSWLVRFKNVGVTYFASCQSGHEQPNALNNYTLKSLVLTTPHSNGATQIPDSEVVGVTRVNRSIQEAVRMHFNDIQRGTFHGNLPNDINPNANAAASAAHAHAAANPFFHPGTQNTPAGPSVSTALNSSNTPIATPTPTPNPTPPNGWASSNPGSGANTPTTGNVSNAFNKGVRSPLDQFEIRILFSIFAPILGNLYFTFTNITLYLTSSALVTTLLSLLATNYNKIVAHRWSINIESIYATVHSIVINQINNKNGQKYYPFMYCLFLLILVNNLIGMIPYSFASTSHFILTFFLSFSIVLGSTILGFTLHNIKFFSLFVPSGCPLALLPLLVLIEFISFLARNVSLGLRLAANILSGHMLLNILSDFTYKIMETNIVYFFVGILPLGFIIAFSALELGIAFIQSQVFVVLSSSYIKDSLELH